MKKLIYYYRVSTASQGSDGLGMAAQAAATEAYAASTGGHAVKAYREVESGTHVDRPELLRAIAHAKRIKATLVVAKLDRLARNVAFTSKLMESGVEFVACDNPHATRLTIHILAAVAEEETRQIGARVKAALAAFAREGRVSKRIRALYPEGVPADVVEAVGGKLGASRPGAPRLTEAARLKGVGVAAARKLELSRDVVEEVGPIAAKLRAQGLTLQAIATKLNEEFTTARGNVWKPIQVSRMLERVAS